MDAKSGYFLSDDITISSPVLALRLICKHNIMFSLLYFLDLFSSLLTYRKSSIKPPVGLIFSNTLEGGLFNLAKRITCSKNTVV